MFFAPNSVLFNLFILVSSNRIYGWVLIHRCSKKQYENDISDSSNLINGRIKYFTLLASVEINCETPFHNAVVSRID